MMDLVAVMMVMDLEDLGVIVMIAMIQTVMISAMALRILMVSTLPLKQSFHVKAGV